MKHMNKVFAIFVFIALPVSVLAMSPLSDDELSSICGRSGVSIMPNIRMNIHIDVLAWGDSDGLGSDNIWGVQTSGGYIGVKNFSLTNLRVRPRSDIYIGMWPITIDVSSGIIQTSDEAYTSLNLTYFQNPYLLPNLLWH
jgi:hypothetical protein